MIGAGSAGSWRPRRSIATIGAWAIDSTAPGLLLRVRWRPPGQMMHHLTRGTSEAVRGPMATDEVRFPQILFCSATRALEETWQPRADVYRMPDGWLVKLELAGVRPDDVQLATR